MQETIDIHPDERGWAAMAHLSGLAGYLVPLGGVLVPIILMFAKSRSPVISNLARQALLLNVVVYILAVFVFILYLTILLIPLAWLRGAAATLAALALPIMGAVKALDGIYFKYPLVGRMPGRASR